MIIYITQKGFLKRESNTIVFENKVIKRRFPIESVEEIYSFDEIKFNSKGLELLNEHSISLHFFDHYGNYTGSFIPRFSKSTGYLLIKQVEHYINNEKRVYLAKEILNGAFHNMKSTLYQYKLKFKENYFQILNRISKIEDLLTFEANVRKFYFNKFNKIIKEDEYHINERKRKPPTNKINSLISFGNSLLYTTTLNEIFKTQLNPEISYLHASNTRKYNLNLDLSEIFKPIIVDRIIFSMINNNMLKEDDFDDNAHFTYLSKKGIKKFIKKFDEKINTTIYHRTLKRKVSYKYLIRLEAYKIIKHLLGDKKYISFKMYW